MSKAKKWLYKYPEESAKLLQLLTDVIVKYLIEQVKAGAQMLQVFESNAEYLNSELFARYPIGLRLWKPIDCNELNVHF